MRRVVEVEVDPEGPGLREVEVEVTLVVRAGWEVTLVWAGRHTEEEAEWERLHSTLRPPSLLRHCINTVPA
jgi:hypothetical protein